MKFIKNNVQIWTAEGVDLKNETDKPVVSKKWIGTTKKVSKQRIVQIFSRIVLPFTTGAFVLLYILAAAYIYNNPDLKYK